MFVSGERWDERDVPIGLGGFVFALQGLGRWGGWNVGLRAVLGLLFNPLPFAVDVIPIIAFPIVVFPIRTGSFFQFSRVGYFRLPVLERKAKSEAWFYEGIAMLVRISDTPFFIDDAVNAFLHGVVAVVIPVRDIEACGMAVARGYGRAAVMIKGEQPYFKQDGKDCKHRADKETEAIALPYRYMERPVIVVHHAVTLLGIDAHIPPEQYGERQYQREKRKAVVCFVKEADSRSAQEL